MPVNFEALVDKIQRAAEDFTNVSVTTVVGKFELDPQTGEAKPIAGGSPKILQSTANIIDGDIKDFVDDAFADDPDHPMRQFHKEQVANARQTVHDTVEAFKSLVSVLADLARQQDAAGGGGSQGGGQQ